VFDLENPLSIQ